MSNVDVMPYLSWTDGRLEFRKVPLSEVRRSLERWYDVHILIADSTLLTVPVSASFEGEPVDVALGRLAQLLDLHYERQGTTVRLSLHHGSP
jgi:ferric-dicitrate binding protein FerR (iron transport regulator)